MLAPGIVLCKLFQHVNLQLGSFAILFDVLDYLERQNFVFDNVLNFNHFSECALAECGHYPKLSLDYVTGVVDKVTLVVVLDDWSSSTPGFWLRRP